MSEGTYLGPYRIVQRIGQGGMATVYRAHHSELDRFVAIKVLPEFFAEDEGYRERFQLEAQSVAGLRHPNILSAFDFGETAGLPYLVMELAEGGTLADRLGSPVELQDVVRLLRPIASALDHAHAHGVLHRDIKPSNILIRQDGTPVLADFGLAKLAHSVRKLTASGVVFGTPEYMSPEQAAGEPLNAATDQYSLAVVAYEMLTGRVPFQGDTPGAVLVSHMRHAVPATRELPGELSAHVDQVLSRALAKAPGDRYATVSDFVAALMPAAWPSFLADERVANKVARPAHTVHTVPVVLVVDDGAANRELIEACLAGIDCEIRSADNGKTALRMIEGAPPDLVLLDVQMPGMDGYEVCSRIKARPRGELLPVVMITALDRSHDRVMALEAGADDFMSKPVERIELVARVRAALRLKALYDKLDSVEQVVFSLAAAVEAKDSFTEKHTQRVGESARLMGEIMNLPEADLDALYSGGIVHDIGKIGVADSILLKPGPLDHEEQVRMHAHPIIGEGIVRPLRSGTSLLPIIRHHHEHFDGTGYPDRLRGAQIPRLARIVSVCDAYDALINDRPYRRGRSPEEAMAILYRGAGTQWDPEVVNLFGSQMPPVIGAGAA
ncbi:MAG TPA: HD domain-containing phosphohydrolase [Candidatus Eisenbacteria bacterium]|nr:HD domain-containing phosphohydrolase [Candidatus Eisenbacteria bacterium]